MSHFSSVRAQIKSVTALVAGLEEFFALHNLNIPIEVHQAAVPLVNTYDRRAAKLYANVILRREHLSRPEQEAYLDIGFERVDDDNFVLHADEWDIQHTVLADILRRTAQVQPEGRNRTSLMQALQIEAQRYHAKAYIKEQFPGWVQSDVTLLPDGTMRGVLQKPQDLCQPVGVSAAVL